MRELATSVVVVPLAAVRLVVDARRVSAIEDASRAEGVTHDLAARMGVALDAQSVAELGRRALQVDGGAWLVAAERVLVRSLRVEAFRPLPSWLGSLHERLGIAALVAFDDGFGFELDVDRVAGGST
ncbi:hypothetical protein [Sandaracinus amylolyticus]|uniref:Uncharacterized protein n=1 Tax=Sandaracinus amylolyticus TaxID=927083 RepID=A0A0F6W4L3_9BACT|nr:hypothetical protein [Sandaracinus amylolyticus]AKF07306.1 hypothetical protein DB32_004455 [Sandaracinus amylolyticus]